MKPGDLVVPNFYGDRIPMYERIHPTLGDYVSALCDDCFGIILDFEYSSWDISYIRILNAEGKIGWIRFEKVKVVT